MQIVVSFLRQYCLFATRFDRRVWLTFAGLSAVLAGCQAQPPDGIFACTTTYECPAGQGCFHGLCSKHDEDLGNMPGSALAAGSGGDSSPPTSTGMSGTEAGSSAAGSGSGRAQSSAGSHAAGVSGGQSGADSGVAGQSTGGMNAGAFSAGTGGTPITAGTTGGMSTAGGAGTMGAAGMAAASGCPSVSNPEQCDNQDNDCDGRVDEALTRPCGSNVGECKPGTQACSAGTWSSECQDAVGPSPEVCDAEMKDENCNDVHNEDCMCTKGETQTCGNATLPCTQGTRTCDNGTWGSSDAACVGGVRPATEVCDGVDNDCDGTVDDSAPCAGNKKCLGGRCVECANTSDCAQLDGRCKVGYCDSNGSCQQKDADEASTCTLVAGGSGVCKAGTCVSCLSSAQCSAPRGVCNTMSNSCVACNVSSDCTTSGTACMDNKCVATCGNGQFDIGEQCDLPGQDAYHCDPATCKSRALYLACQPSTSNACANGETNADCGYGYCSPHCSSVNDCPKPTGKDQPVCSGGLCLLSCNALTDCPPGFGACSGGLCLGPAAASSH